MQAKCCRQKVMQAKSYAGKMLVQAKCNKANMNKANPYKEKVY